MVPGRYGLIKGAHLAISDRAPFLCVLLRKDKSFSDALSKGVIDDLSDAVKDNRPVENKIADAVCGTWLNDEEGV